MPALFRRLERAGSRLSCRIVKEPPPLIALIGGSQQNPHQT